MSSGRPPTRVAITAHPLAIASRQARLWPSLPMVGITQMSAPW